MNPEESVTTTDMPGWVRILLRAIRRALLAFCSDVEPLCKSSK